MFFYAAKRLLRESSSASAESIRNGYYGRLYLIGFVMDCRNQRFSCQVSLCTTHSVLYMCVCLDGLFSGIKWLWISSSHVMKWCGVVHLQIKDVQQEFLKHCPKGHDRLVIGVISEAEISTYNHVGIMLRVGSFINSCHYSPKW